MDIEAFPEIESFQKLPKQVIVKAGSLSFESSEVATLQGIVINNCGHSIRDLVVNIVVFDNFRIPVLNTSRRAEPDHLPQGGMANFSFRFDEMREGVKDFHLYTNWRFDD